MVRLSWVMGVIGAACGTIVLDTSRAAACGETPCAQPEEPLPLDGSAGIPTNVVPRVAFTGYLGSEEGPCPVEIDELRVEPRDMGAVVVPAILEIDGTSYPKKWLVAQLTEELQPNTRYTVLSHISETGQCACEGEPHFGAWHGATEFITGDGPDHEPPILDPDAIDVRYGEVMRGSNTCGDYHWFNVEVLTPVAPEGGSQQIRYNLYLDGELHMRYARSGPSVVIHCAAEGDGFVATSRELSVRMIDLAGNESEDSATFELQDRCAGDEPGAMSTPDAGESEQDGGQPTVMPEDESAPSAESSSCSAVTTAPSWAGLWLLALLVRSRRRARP